MSNLYKQYFVRTETEKKRVINSNALLEERLAKVLEQQRREQMQNEMGEEGFSAGIIGENTEVLSEAELISNAAEEAERILEEARIQAEEIKADAEKTAEAIYEEAKAKGYKEGASQKIAAG